MAVDVWVCHHPVRRLGTICLIALAAVMVARYALALYRSQIDMLNAGHHPASLVVMNFAAVILVGGFLSRSRPHRVRSLQASTHTSGVST